jgi:hypothetical protein
MWTRMKEHLKKTGIAPSDAIYLCGAVHAVSDVPEFGTRTDAVWEIPKRTPTKWLYGLIPSSYIAIEHQFHHPAGTVAIAESTWEKGIEALGVRPWKLGKAKSVAATPATKQRPSRYQFLRLLRLLERRILRVSWDSLPSLLCCTQRMRNSCSSGR